MLLRLSLVFCLLISNTAGAEIYKWVDDQGVTHFGDKPNSNAATQTMDVKKREQIDVEVKLTPIEYDMPFSTREKTQRAIRNVRRIYVDFLGVELNELDDFDIKLFGTWDSFQDYKRIHYGSSFLENSSGVFSSKRKEAIVWKNRNTKTMLNVLTHEMSHALFDMAFPNIHRPVWLNEGFAEYIEEIDVFGQAIYIRSNEYWKDALKEASQKNVLPPLKDYLSMDWQMWRLYDQKTNGMGYAMGWSICFLLMDSRYKENYLREIFSDLREHQNNFNAVDTIERVYPGGIKGLQTVWDKWVKRGYVPGHSY